MYIAGPLEGAAARGVPIVGRVLGAASTSDAFHITAPDPEAKQAARAIELALADAGVTAADVDYVNAHGTSTELNDLSETRAVHTALGDRADQIPISSTKWITSRWSSRPVTAPRAAARSPRLDRRRAGR